MLITLFFFLTQSWVKNGSGIVTQADTPICSHSEYHDDWLIGHPGSTPPAPSHLLLSQDLIVKSSALHMPLLHSEYLRHSFCLQNKAQTPLRPSIIWSSVISGTHITWHLGSSLAALLASLPTSGTSTSARNAFLPLVQFLQGPAHFDLHWEAFPRYSLQLPWNLVGIIWYLAYPDLYFYFFYICVPYFPF